jgi:hypothetical protein
VPERIRGDSLWRVEAYRLALFAADMGWQDSTRLMGDRRTFGVSDQLYRALGSVSANLAEGYSRGTGRDRAHFYEHVAEIMRLLLTIIPQQRGQVLREETELYAAESAADMP